MYKRNGTTTVDPCTTTVSTMLQNSLALFLYNKKGSCNLNSISAVIGSMRFSILSRFIIKNDVLGCVDLKILSHILTIIILNKYEQVHYKRKVIFNKTCNLILILCHINLITWFLNIFWKRFGQLSENHYPKSLNSVHKHVFYTIHVLQLWNPNCSKVTKKTFGGHPLGLDRVKLWPNRLFPQYKFTNIGQHSIR